MRSHALAGGALAVAVALTVALSSVLELDLLPLALAGVAVGGAVALIPAGNPGLRAVGFIVGTVLGLIGYVVRAAVLPDITAGRAVAFGLIVVLVTLAAVATRGRMPLWSTLLGAGTFSAVYEAAYVANPPQVLTTSFSTLFALLPAFAIGYLVAVLTEPTRSLAPTADGPQGHVPAQSTDSPTATGTTGTTSLEKTR
ncbi:hypothetical protein KLP28_13225 [Nocardioidaceae bacterium]|nr:hypothetical protein KLP28_13225 [Nocardioidaceae bacterium]